MSTSKEFGDVGPISAAARKADFVIHPPVRTAANQLDDTPATTTKIAFGSCHKSKYADAHIWSTIAAEQPALFFWTGDAIYPPVRNIASVTQLQHEYNRMLMKEEDDNTTPANDTIGYATKFLYFHNDKATTAAADGIDPPHQPPVVVFGTWDDHDYGGNDRGVEMPDREARAAAYWDFLQKTPPTSTTGTTTTATTLPNQEQQQMRKGVYYSVVWEDHVSSTEEDTTQTLQETTRTVQTIFLDTRWHRQAHCLVPSLAGQFPLGAGLACLSRWFAAGFFPRYCTRHEPDHAMLGSDQWQWLEEQLLGDDHDRNHHQTTNSAKATQSSSSPNVILIVSSVQVLTTNPAMESWGQFPRERDRLIELLAQTRRTHKNTVVAILSGDVHHGEILSPQPNDNNNIDAAPFLEVTSSGLTHDCSKHIYGIICRPLLNLFSGHRRRSAPEYYIGRNFGTIEIDWEATTVEIKVHKVETGEVALTTGKRSWYNSSKQNSGDTIASPLRVRPCMDGHLIPFAWSGIVVIFVTLLLSKRMRQPIQIRGDTMR